jgi:hypothetical protein
MSSKPAAVYCHYRPFDIMATTTNDMRLSAHDEQSRALTLSYNTTNAIGV